MLFINTYKGFNIMGSPKNYVHITKSDIDNGITQHVTTADKTKLNNVWLSGTTGSRPTGIVVGFMYFDTSLGYAIWWNGSHWVDYKGTTV